MTVNEQTATETAAAKLAEIEKYPGLEVYFTPDEADAAGFIPDEDAVPFEVAEAAQHDDKA